MQSGGNATAQKIQEAAEIAENGEENSSDLDSGEVADDSHDETDYHQDDSDIVDLPDDHRDRDSLDRDWNEQPADLKDDDIDQQRVHREGERKGMRTLSARLPKLPVKFNEYVMGPNSYR